jgi:hypothetical protein
MDAKIEQRVCVKFCVKLGKSATGLLKCFLRLSRNSDGLQAGLLGSIPDKGKKIFSTPRSPDRPWGLPMLLSSGYDCSSPGTKNGGAIHPFPHTS